MSEGREVTGEIMREKGARRQAKLCERRDGVDRRNYAREGREATPGTGEIM